MIQPTPTQIKAARISAGDTQKSAGARVHCPSNRTWQDWERGERPMNLAAWELYLIKTGQLAYTTQAHPHIVRAPRSGQPGQLAANLE